MGEGALHVGMRGSLFDPHPFIFLVLFFCPFFPSVSLHCSLIPRPVLLFDVLIFLPLSEFSVGLCALCYSARSAILVVLSY